MSSKKIKCPGVIPLLEVFAVSDTDLFGTDRQPWSELSGADKLERLSFGKRAIRDSVVTLRKRIFARIPPLELHTHTITSV